MRKEGTAFDLPIALALLVATGQLRPDALSNVVAVGELGLDGCLRAMRGTHFPPPPRVAKVTSEP